MFSEFDFLGEGLVKLFLRVRFGEACFTTVRQICQIDFRLLDIAGLVALPFPVLWAASVSVSRLANGVEATLICCTHRSTQGLRRIRRRTASTWKHLPRFSVCGESQHIPRSVVPSSRMRTKLLQPWLNIRSPLLPKLTKPSETHDDSRHRPRLSTRTMDLLPQLSDFAPPLCFSTALFCFLAIHLDAWAGGNPPGTSLMLLRPRGPTKWESLHGK